MHKELCHKAREREDAQLELFFSGVFTLRCCLHNLATKTGFNLADHVKFHADALNKKAENALVDVAVTDDAALAEFAKTAGKPIT